MATKLLYVKSIVGTDPISVFSTNNEVFVSANIPLTSLTSVGTGQNLVYDSVGPALQVKSLGGSSPYINVIANVDGQTINVNANLVAFDARYAVTMLNTGDGVGQVDDGIGPLLRIKDLIAGNNISITAGTSGQGNRITANEPPSSTTHILNASPSIAQVLVDGSDVQWGSVASSSSDINLTTTNSRATATVAGDYLVDWSVVYTISLLAGRMGVAVNGSFIGGYSIPGRLHQGNAIVHLNVGDFLTIKSSGILSATIDLTAPSSSYIFMRRLTNLR